MPYVILINFEDTQNVGMGGDVAKMAKSLTVQTASRPDEWKDRPSVQPRRWMSVIIQEKGHLDLHGKYLFNSFNEV